MFSNALASGTVGLSLLLSGLTAAPALAASPASEASPCVFETYKPDAVSAYYVEDPAWYSSDKTLRGVHLYISAREGLTKEWLQLSVQRAFASPAHGGDQSCRPAVGKVDVSVSSAGAGFWVSLSSMNQRSAETLLKWAKANIVACDVGAERTSCSTSAHAR